MTSDALPSALDLPAPRNLDTRTALRLAARRLVAERGVQAVSVRDILKAADVKNGSAIAYYFGTKEDLLRELVESGARLIDERRIRMIEELETSGCEITLHDLVSLLIGSALNLSRAPTGEDTYYRFAAAVQSSAPRLYHEATRDRWDRGRRRAVEHVQRLLPDVPAEILSLRLALVHELGNAVLTRREALVAEGGREGARWTRPDFIANFIDAVVAMLGGPATVPPRI